MPRSSDLIEFLADSASDLVRSASCNTSSGPGQQLTEAAELLSLAARLMLRHDVIRDRRVSGRPMRDAA